MGEYDRNGELKNLTPDEKANNIFMLKFLNLSKYIEESKGNDLGNISLYNIIDDLFTDEGLDEKRLNFYKEFMKNLNNTTVLKGILDQFNKSKKKIKKVMQLKRQFYGLANKYMEMKKINGDGLKKKLQDGGGKLLNKYLDNMSDDSEIKKRIKGYDDLFNKNGDANIEDELRGFLKKEYGIENLQKLKEPILKLSSDDAEKFDLEKNSIQQFIDDYYEAHNEDTKDKIANKLKIAIDKLENAPDNALESLKISHEDRLVFILTTFFIRYITVLLIQWCIDINLIREFYQGFLLYAVIYVAFFWFIVMFVNVNTLPSISYMDTEDSSGVIKSIFYYFYMGTNGISRLLTHTVLIIILLIVPLLLNIHDKRENPEDFLTYDEKKKLLKTLSLFTIFIWVLTSIIATKF